ncbi:MAG: phosphatidylinositol-specific phospholipase C domain-containing protein [Verrucomicrobiota bacterium]
MDEWNPCSEISPNSYAQFSGAYKLASLTTYNIDDSAKADYSLDEYPDFKVKIRVKMKGVDNLPSPYVPTDYGYGILVKWENIPDGVFVYPPPDVNGESAVGWIHNGTVSIGIGYFDGQTQQAVPAYPTPEYAPPLTLPTPPPLQPVEYPSKDTSALEPSVKNWAKTWMELYLPCLGHLKLTELTLPGTHDAGTYNADGMEGGWKQTQSLNIQQQLEQGIRAIDIRLMIDGTGDTRFQFSHDDYLVNLSFIEGAQLINDFLRETDQEIVILDFHRLNGSWTAGDIEDLALLITDTFGSEQIIPESQSGETISTILSTSGRIVVGLGKYTHDLPDGAKTWLEDNVETTNFWSNKAVKQYWCGESLTTWSTVSDYMDSILNDVNSPHSYLWALMAQYNSYTAVGQPANIPVELSNYFTGEAALRSNIMDVDWWSYCSLHVEEVDFPNYSTLINTLPINILKGYRASIDQPLF